MKQPRKLAGRNKNEARGTQSGNKRGKERQARRTRIRMQDPRVVDALEKAREHNASLRAVAGEVFLPGSAPHEHTSSTPTVGDPPRYACCAQLVPEPEPEPVRTVVRKRKVPLPYDGDGNGNWSLGQARSMLRQGYTIAHVVKVTGFGTRWFNDMPLVDERGLSLEEQWEN